MSEIADHQFDPAPVIDTNDSEFKTLVFKALFGDFLLDNLSCCQTTNFVLVEWLKFAESFEYLKNFLVSMLSTLLSTSIFALIMFPRQTADGFTTTGIATRHYNSTKQTQVPIWGRSLRLPWDELKKGCKVLAMWIF